MKKMLVLVGAMVALMAFAAAGGNGATKVFDPVLWSDGELYSTVLTPIALPDKIPMKALDKLYVFDDSGLEG